MPVLKSLAEHSALPSAINYGRSELAYSSHPHLLLRLFRRLKGSKVLREIGNGPTIAYRAVDRFRAVALSDDSTISCTIS